MLAGTDRLISAHGKRRLSPAVLVSEKENVSEIDHSAHRKRARSPQTDCRHRHCGHCGGLCRQCAQALVHLRRCIHQLSLRETSGAGPRSCLERRRASRRRLYQFPVDLAYGAGTQTVRASRAAVAPAGRGQRSRSTRHGDLVGTATHWCVEPLRLHSGSPACQQQVFHGLVHGWS